MNSLLRIVVVVFVMVVLPTHCWAQVPSTGSAPMPPDSLQTEAPVSRTAFLLFISGDQPDLLPMSIGDLRTTSLPLLNDSLLLAGHASVSYLEIAPLLTRWRVRQTWSNSKGFLNDLAELKNADRLFIAHLMVRPGRYQLTGRWMSTRTGELLGINIVEYRMETVETLAYKAQGTPWLDALRNGFRAIVPAHAPLDSLSEPEFLVLPTTPTEITEDMAAMATYCLLESILSGGMHKPMDPGIVVNSLWDQGQNSRHPGAEALDILRQDFFVESVLQGDLISFEEQRGGFQSTGIYSDSDTALLFNLPDYNFLVLETDLRTGMILNAVDFFSPKKNSTGWFGVPLEDSLIDRLRESTQTTWDQLSEKREES